MLCFFMPFDYSLLINSLLLHIFTLLSPSIQQILINPPLYRHAKFNFSKKNKPKGLTPWVLMFIRHVNLLINQRSTYS